MSASNRDLFVYGPAGCGKTTFAPFIAKQLGLVNLDRNPGPTPDSPQIRHHIKKRNGVTTARCLFTGIDRPKDWGDIEVVTFFEAMKMACGVR